MTKISLRVDAPGDPAALRSLLVLRELRSKEETRKQREMRRGRSNHQGGGLVSLRSSLWRYLGLLAVAALAAGVFAGPASAKKLSAKQRAAVRTQLKKQIKKNPAVINRKSFVKRASLVNFKLPVTIALRGGKTATNPNSANVDLGASLGSRVVNLGGSLSAELTFHDSYDGGALGNVDLSILPSANHHLTSTSIPLLWNTQVSDPTTHFDANSVGRPSAESGCGDFKSTAAGSLDALSFTGDGLLNHINLGVGVLPSTVAPANTGLPGFPFFDAQPTSATQTPDGYLPIRPGIDAIDKVTPSKIVGNDLNVGGTATPFPGANANSTPFDASNTIPSATDTVLRTNALDLNVAHVGDTIKQDLNTDGVSGSQNIVIGKSGGQANLFGKIPGKSYGIDVTVSLATRINSILRVVDQDSFGSPLIAGNRYPAGIFNCRQIWTGGIDNYIPDVRLAGNLKISPGITSDGKLRIAKATVSSLPGSESRFAVAACLAPYASYDNPRNGSDVAGTAKIPFSSTATPVPTPGGPIKVADNGILPADTSVPRGIPDPSVKCNAAPTGLIADSALGTASVTSLAPANPVDGYTVTNSGSSVSVGADLSVQNISLDVLVGDVNATP
jgi:hypothetical protein